MLPNEIEPFANHHIEELDAVRRLLIEIQGDETLDIPVEQIENALMRIGDARNAFVRFKVCMADEVRQKTLYRDRWMELRFPKD